MRRPLLGRSYTKSIFLAAIIASGAGCGSGPPDDTVAQNAESIAQPAGTEAEFWSFTNDGATDTLLSGQNWGRNWESITPIHFPGRAYTSLLFYDRTANMAKLYHTNGNGSLSFVRSYTGWSKWDSLTPITLPGQKQALFFFSRGQYGSKDDPWPESLAKRGKVYEISETGGLTLRADESYAQVSGNRGFDAVAAGHFTGSDWLTSDLVGYDRDSGRLHFFEWDHANNDFDLSLTQYVGRRWDNMLAGNFVGDSGTDILLWDRETHKVRVLENINGTFTGAQTYTWPSADNLIISVGQFGGDAHDDLLTYDARPNSNAGESRFYISDGSGDFSSATTTNSSLRTSWSRVVTGKFSNSGHSEVLFYDNTYYLKLKILQMKDGVNGKPLVSVSTTTAQRWVDEFNRVYATAGVRFVGYELIEGDNTAVYGHRCNPDNTTATREEVNAWIRSNVGDDSVVVLVNGDPDHCGSSLAEFFKLSPNDNDELAHELGHYFGLDHVHSLSLNKLLKAEFTTATDEFGNNCLQNPARAKEIYGQFVAANPGQADGDRGTTDTPERPRDPILDTGADPGPYYWALMGIDRCTEGGQAEAADADDGNGTRLISGPEPQNVMGYEIKPGFPGSCVGFEPVGGQYQQVPYNLDFRCRDTAGNILPGTITSEQARRVRQHIRDNRPGLLQ